MKDRGIGAMNEGVSAENGGISAEAIDRKLRSETILRAEGVPFLAVLPVIETTAEALKRSKEEVALRTLCLLFVAAKGVGLEDEVVEGVLEAYELRPHLTPKELAFVLDNSPSQHDRIIHVEVRSRLDSALGVGLRGRTRQASSGLRHGFRGQDDDRNDNLSVHRGLRTSSDRRYS